MNEDSNLEKDAERFRWLMNQGFAWRDCYDGYWQPGEWLYYKQEAREVIDNFIKNKQNHAK